VQAIVRDLQKDYEKIVAKNNAKPVQVNERGRRKGQNEFTKKYNRYI